MITKFLKFSGCFLPCYLKVEMLWFLQLRMLKFCKVSIYINYVSCNSTESRWRWCLTGAPRENLDRRCLLLWSSMLQKMLTTHLFWERFTYGHRLPWNPSGLKKRFCVFGLLHGDGSLFGTVLVTEFYFLVLYRILFSRIILIYYKFWR